jgi:hypothetical protein
VALSIQSLAVCCGQPALGSRWNARRDAAPELAQAIGGSGFIACFAGGLLLGALLPEHKHERLRDAEGAGEALSLMTWLSFGSIVAGQLSADRLAPATAVRYSRR